LRVQPVQEENEPDSVPRIGKGKDDRAETLWRGERGEKQTEAPRGVSDVWQTKDLQDSDFGSVASKGLTGEFSDLWQLKGLAAFLQEVENC